MLSSLQTRNTLHSRKSSIQYYVASSLHKMYTPYKYIHEGCNTLINSKNCIYCGIEFSTQHKQTIDHIYPLMIEGLPSKKMVYCKQNHGLCCSTCNSSKSNHCHIKWMIKKNFSIERLNLINRQIEIVPTFSDETYHTIILKYKRFMTNHENNIKELAY